MLFPNSADRKRGLQYHQYFLVGFKAHLSSDYEFVVKAPRKSIGKKNA
jgi:hypothetical protein